MTKQAPSIGESVRVRRVALDLSQRGLARAADTTAAAISHIERGMRNPSAGLLARISLALGCSADDLLRGEGRPAGPARHIEHVVAAMKSLPDALQKEIVDFCEYLKHRSRKAIKQDIE